MALLSIDNLKSKDFSSPAEQRKLNSYLYKLMEEIQLQFNQIEEADPNSDFVRLLTSAEAMVREETSIEKIELSYSPVNGVMAVLRIDGKGISGSAKKIELTGKDDIILTGIVSINDKVKIDKNGTLISSGSASFQGTMAVSGTATFSGNMNVTGTSNFTGTINGCDAVFEGTLSADTIESDSTTFRVNSDGITLPGFEFLDSQVFHSTWFGNIENPVTEDSSMAGIHASQGKAWFHDVYILDSWMEGGTGPIESGQHLWSVLECLEWLDGRITSLENECWTDCSDSDDSDSGEGSVDAGNEGGSADEEVDSGEGWCDTPMCNIE